MTNVQHSETALLSDLNNSRLFKLLDSVVLFMLLGHSGFIVLFSVLGKTEMIILNAGFSVPVLTFSLLLIRKKRYPRLRLILPYAELLVHSLVASIFLGWEAGFYLYLVAGIVLTQIYPWKQIVKVAIGAFLTIVIGLLYAFSYKGCSEFDVFTEQVLFLLNLAGMVSYMTYFLFFQMKLSGDLENALSDSNGQLANQKDDILNAHTEIQDSINYAKRIQRALIPTEEQLHGFFPESYLVYEPKDIIAGDFYWLSELKGIKFVAVADCTGHGVPGAMVSVVCINALKRSIVEFQLTDPGEILTQTRALVVDQFGSSTEEINDGMDIILIAIEGSLLKFAGAHNSLYIIRNGELIELKGDKQPVGKYISNEPFVSKEMILQNQDELILYSDGFADQFGGVNGKKYKSSNFKKFLLSHSETKMADKAFLVAEEFRKWKGDHEQIDDVTVLGIKTLLND